MNSPDQANLDPRSPANFEDVTYTHFYIDPNQFSAEDLASLSAVSGVDVVMDEEGAARDAAYRAARWIMKPVQYDKGHEHLGDVVYDDMEIVKPIARVA